MTRSNLPQQEGDYVISRLRANGVYAIAMIDDAFDDSIEGEVGSNEINSFLTSIRMKEDSRDQFMTFLREHNIEELSPDVLDDGDLLNELWQQRNVLTNLGAELEQLFSRKLQKLRQLNSICDKISTRCTENDEAFVNIKKLDSHVDIANDLREVAIVFLDYRMGADDNDLSIANAERIAKQIYETFADTRMPLIILMSANQNLEEVKERFRERSGLLSGLFHCVSKSNLGNESNLGINLGVWAERLEKGEELQRFVNTIKDSIESLNSHFINSIKSLSLEDYAYIQNLSLMADGHPLGDYMLTIFSAHLGSVLFEMNESVRRQQAVIDQLSFERLPINMTMPSPQLVDMYDSALFNKNVGDISHHPALPNQASNSGTETEISILYSGEQPNLSLGLLFINSKENEVRMVINADCDLAYSVNRKRRVEADTSILLVPGKLQELIQGQPIPDGIRTEFFRFQEKSFRINWQITKLMSVKYKDTVALLTADGFSPYARLRPPYALEIQRAFAANLTRIGLPVAPPFMMPARVKILRKSGAKDVEPILAESADLAFLVLFKDSQEIENKHQMRCYFTASFGQELKRVVFSLIDMYQQLHDESSELDADARKRNERLTRKVQRLTNFIQGFDKWFLQSHYLPLSYGDGITQFHDLIAVSRNGVGEEGFINSNHLLLVDLIDN